MKLLKKKRNLFRALVNGNVLSTKRTHVFQCNGYRLDKVFFISFLRLSGLMEYFNGTGNLFAPPCF